MCSSDLEMHCDTEDDIAEMAVFTRENGHMDWHVHGVTTQGQQHVLDDLNDIM